MCSGLRLFLLWINTIMSDFCPLEIYGKVYTMLSMPSWSLENNNNGNKLIDAKEVSVSPKNQPWSSSDEEIKPPFKNEDIS